MKIHNGLGDDLQWVLLKKEDLKADSRPLVVVNHIDLGRLDQVGHLRVQRAVRKPVHGNGSVWIASQRLESSAVDNDLTGSQIYVTTAPLHGNADVDDVAEIGILNSKERVVD